MKNIYFDNAATTFVDGKVLDTMLPYFSDEFANPGGSYTAAKRAKKAVEDARECIAKIIGAKTSEIYFTSGGTEGDNMLIKGMVYSLRPYRNHIVTSVIEHNAVLNTCKYLEKQGSSVSYIPTDKYGFVDMNRLKRSINRHTAIVSIMMANNEIGTIENVEEIGRICRSMKVPFHSDCVQAFGHIPVNVNKLGIDMISISSHKIHGPKGVGAVYIKDNLSIYPLIHGGNQERGMRSGTENVAGIVGFAMAAKLAHEKMTDNYMYCCRLRNYIINRLRKEFDDVMLNGPDCTMEKMSGTRLPGNINISFQGVSGYSIVDELSKRGICSSSGSACSQSKKGPSHVLMGIGLGEERASSALRLSIEPENTFDEADYVISCLKEIIKQ